MHAELDKRRNGDYSSGRFFSYKHSLSFGKMKIKTLENIVMTKLTSCVKLEMLSRAPAS